MKPRRDSSNSKRYLADESRNDDQFKIQEKDLREKDMQIQEGMIKFSIFLQDNEKKKKKYDTKIEEEQKVRLIYFQST